MFTRGGILHFPERFQRSMTASWSLSLYTTLTILPSLHLLPFLKNSVCSLRFSTKHTHIMDGATV